MSDSSLPMNPGSAPSESPIPRAQLPRDPATVVNPERRPTPASDEAQPTPNSSIVRTLFPAVDVQVPLTEESELQLGHFRIVERIRTGGMGAVFRAHDVRLNRTVAIKILPPAQARDLSAVQRFRNEAQAAAQLDHENIARVYFIGEDQGLHFIAFEFVRGPTVRDLILEQGRLPVEDAVNYTLQIASALAHTSAHGVIHRDIKPSNIIITRNSRAKLVDMGLARNENNDEAMDLTAPGTTLGTFDYISPEQAYDPRSADVRSDLYSLGCTLYHMLTGEPPYPEGTVMQKLLQHKGDDAPDAAARNRRVPENLSAITRRMMAKDPRRRYQTAEELIQDLMVVAGSLGLRSISPEGLVWISSASARPPFWERHLAWMATLAALLIIVAVLESPWRASTQVTQKSPSPFLPKVEPHKSPEAPPAQGSTSAPDKLPATETVSLEATPKKPDESIVKVGETTPAAVPSVARFNVDPAGAYSLQPGLEVSTSRFGPETSPGDLLALGPASLDLSASRTVTKVEPAESTGVSASELTNQNSPPAVPAEKLDAVWMISRGVGQAYGSLAAACAQAEDGAVIELGYNGFRNEPPIRLSKKISIVAAKGFRPGISFGLRDEPPAGPQSRMLTITQGALELVGVDLQMTVDPNASADSWFLLSLTRPEMVRLKGVTITVRSPRPGAAAVIELPPGSATTMPEMNMEVMTRPPLEIEFSGCFVRGAADLVLSRNLDPVRITVSESIVALNGALFQARGDQAGKPGEERIDLRFDHVTASLAAGLIKFEGGTTPRRFLPVQVNATNCIFTTAASAPLVSMAGAAPAADFRRLLAWNGRKNFYDQYVTFWSIASTDSPGVPETLDFRAWQRTWGPASEVDTKAEPVIWLHYWENRPAADFVPSDFALYRGANNPAVAGATTRNDAGADLDNLERLGITGKRSQSSP